ncbi:MAG: tRNA 2-thiocytidine biosynthesis protein TtcA [Oscillospiraceae bacterium]|nr:tRNA 2-thiocytidine biosynthesis protein TtcA [Oscillospiraceae bacterium]
MQNIMSRMRRCIDDYEMIAPGDKIAVGISGGKDSLVLLAGLAGLRRFYPNKFELQAVTIDLGMGMDFSPVEQFCRGIDVPYTVVKTQIKEVVFDVRREENPCSLCARMRKGAINDASIAAGCNKIALGHHFDDAVETFIMNQVFEGRIGCFDPVTYMSRANITQIRPMLYMGENMIAAFAERENLPVVKNTCPADGETRREEIKKLLSELSEKYPDYKNKIFTAMQRLPLGNWAVKK